MRPPSRGRWGATLRIGLAMGQVVDRVALSDDDLVRSFVAEMAGIREALIAAVA